MKGYIGVICTLIPRKVWNNTREYMSSYVPLAKNGSCYGVFKFQGLYRGVL